VDLRAIDAGLALVLTVAALAEPGALSDPSRTLVLVAMTAAIAWVHRAPVAVLGVEVAGVAALHGRVDLPQGVAVLVAAYAAALYSDRRLVVVVLLLTASAVLLAFSGPATIPAGLIPLLLVAPVWLAGSAMRRRDRRAEDAARRADRSEQDREAALRAERARIARELHDVVTHSVSLMVLQTGAARQIMSQDEHRSQALLESVEDSGRSALEELRRLLGLLADRERDAPLSPQPGVSEIPVLIEQVRKAGVPVELGVEGRPRVVPGGVAVAAYRIVQEALTNVLKHAGGAPSRVVLRWSDGELELEIVDHGPRRDAVTRDGRGLAGMRQRAAMYGGTLDTRPGPNAGYVVRARIPLQSRSA
jgi:signal transduction histidine kinase